MLMNSEIYTSSRTVCVTFRSCTSYSFTAHLTWIWVILMNDLHKWFICCNIMCWCNAYYCKLTLYMTTETYIDIIVLLLFTRLLSLLAVTLTLKLLLHLTVYFNGCFPWNVYVTQTSRICLGTINHSSVFHSWTISKTM